jgi:hypothetical protein
MDSLLELFCDVDDFCKVVLPIWQNRLLTSGAMQRRRKSSLSISAIMTMLIYFHQSHSRHCKASDTEHVLKHLRSEFPGLVSDTRVVEWIPAVVVPLCVYLRTACLGRWTGIACIDSTALAVCTNPTIPSHKVFAGLAERGKTSTGWFVGFNLHLVCNDCGALLNLLLTPGHVADRKPVPNLAHQRFGTWFGDKGYLSQALRDERFRTLGVELVTGIRSTMKKVPMPLMDNILLRKRAMVATIIDHLKNLSPIDHSRHRSPINFLVNLLCGLIAYCRRPKQPSLGLGTLPALVA